MIANAWTPCKCLFSNKAWCAHVTVAPEANKIDVLSNGTWKGLKTKILAGGHSKPSSKVGLKLLWKNAQKKEKKNKISDTINKIIPQRKPTPTLKVCKPWNLPSREISRHHWNIDRIIPKIPKINKFML